MTYRKLITHAACADGLASAMIVRDALPDIEVVFAQYNTPSLDDLEPSEGLLFCDISPPPERAALFVAAGAVVLDHHASARPVVEAFGDRGIFADEVSQPGVSGATLAFEHVWRKIVTHPDTWPATIEDFAQLVGVRDTWQTQHPQWWRACDLQAVLLGLPRDYWMMNRDRIPDAVSPRLLELGEAFRAQHARKVQGVVEGGTLAVVDGAGRTWQAFPDPHKLTSDVAEALRACDRPLSVGFFTVLDDAGKLATVLSFRSDGSVDVAALAHELGGGGHSRAAGCQLPYSDPWDALAVALKIIR